MTEPVNESSVSQMDYLKLFMQELTYQDPLKPVDNKEFMAQMAQFSALQELRTNNEHLETLLGMSSGTQSLMLLGKQIKLPNSDKLGKVIGVLFEEKSPPKLKIKCDDEPPMTIGIGEVREVSA